MKCDVVTTKISFLPKGELPFDERQKVMNHLQSCAHCNKEYQEYLRMFYLIDKQVDVNIPDKTLINFSSEIMKKINRSQKNRIMFNRIIWYAAAAVIIFILILSPFYQSESPLKINRELENVSITELIQSEDWETVLQKFEDNDIPQELISVSLLLSKFSEIDIKKVNNTLKEKFGENKEFNNLIKILIDYQRFNDGISTNKIAKYLKNKPGATS